MRNKEGYKDPTAGAAIASVRRQEKRRRKEEKMEYMVHVDYEMKGRKGYYIREDLEETVNKMHRNQILRIEKVALRPSAKVKLIKYVEDGILKEENINDITFYKKMLD